MYKVVRVAQGEILVVYLEKNFWLWFTSVFVCLNTYLLIGECVWGVLLERAAQCGNANQGTIYKLIVAS